MIVVTVEMWPGGSEERKRVLGEARIINDLSGDLLRGNYYGGVVNGRRRSVRGLKYWRVFEVRGFPRRSLNVWDLLLRSLLVAVGKRSRGTVRAWLEDQHAKKEK